VFLSRDEATPGAGGTFTSQQQQQQQQQTRPRKLQDRCKKYKLYQYRLAVLSIKPLTPELNPSAQRYLTRFFTGDFAS
jgi:hypothetical protein